MGDWHSFPAYRPWFLCGRTVHGSAAATRATEAVAARAPAPYTAGSSAAAPASGNPTPEPSIA